MTNLGNICERYGLDAEDNPDYKGALKWYTEAAQLVDPKAKLNLGNLYHYGHGVRKNYRKAAESICHEISENSVSSGYILQWDQSNKSYILTHGVSGVDWRFYKHPLPEHVYDIYMKYWKDVDFVT